MFSRGRGDRHCWPIPVRARRSVRNTKLDAAFAAARIARGVPRRREGLKPAFCRGIVGTGNRGPSPQCRHCVGQVEQRRSRAGSSLARGALLRLPTPLAPSPGVRPDASSPSARRRADRGSVAWTFAKLFLLFLRYQRFGSMRLMGPLFCLRWCYRGRLVAKVNGPKIALLRLILKRGRVRLPTQGDGNVHSTLCR
jgi:hypothetical protein